MQQHTREAQHTRRNRQQRNEKKNFPSHHQKKKPREGSRPAYWQGVNRNESLDREPPNPYTRATMEQGKDRARGGQNKEDGEMIKGTRKCYGRREYRTLSHKIADRLEVCRECAEVGRQVGKEYQSLRVLGSCMVTAACQAWKTWSV